MKTKLLFILIMLSSFCKAQIKMEHSFSGQAGCFSTSNGIKYWNVNKYPLDSIIVFYNSDYSVYKSVEINRSINNYGIYNVYLVSDKLFNTDNIIEFIIDNNESLSVYNELGTKLIDLCGAGFYPKSVFNIGNQTKILFTSNSYDPDSAIIYSVLGQLTETSIITLKSALIDQAYPNPSKTTISLPYSLNDGEISTMQIFNVKGVLIETKTIGSNYNKILLNVENYPAGVYLYEVKGQSGKFVVK